MLGVTSVRSWMFVDQKCALSRFLDWICIFSSYQWCFTITIFMNWRSSSSLGICWRKVSYFELICTYMTELADSIILKHYVSRVSPIEDCCECLSRFRPKLWNTMGIAGNVLLHRIVSRVSRIEDCLRSCECLSRFRPKLWNTMGIAGNVLLHRIWRHHRSHISCETLCLFHFKLTRVTETGRGLENLVVHTESAGSFLIRCSMYYDLKGGTRQMLTSGCSVIWKVFSLILYTSNLSRAEQRLLRFRPQLWNAKKRYWKLAPYLKPVFPVVSLLPTSALECSVTCDFDVLSGSDPNSGTQWV